MIVTQRTHQSDIEKILSAHTAQLQSGTVYVCVCVCVCMYVYMYVCVCERERERESHTFIIPHTPYIHAHTHTFTPYTQRTHTHAHTHTHTHTCIHTYAHTYSVEAVVRKRDEEIVKCTQKLMHRTTQITQLKDVIRRREDTISNALRCVCVCRL